jgi:hypothetical protein
MARYLYELEGLSDVSDEWQGTVYSQRIPPDFIDLCQRIAEWAAKSQPTNVVSHGVGGYYNQTVATGPDGLPAGWQRVFANELRPYRRSMLTGVTL